MQKIKKIFFVRNRHILNTTQKKQAMQNTANKTTPVQSPLMTAGQETRWAYSTMLPSSHSWCWWVLPALQDNW